MWPLVGESASEAASRRSMSSDPSEIRAYVTCEVPRQERRGMHTGKLHVDQKRGWRCEWDGQVGRVHPQEF